MYLSAGQTSNYTGAAGLLAGMPKAKTLLVDRGYDADWFRNALIDRGITPCIPSRKNRTVQIEELCPKVGDGGIGWHIKALLTRRRSRRE